ncbi:hypothetical protein OC861_002353 [Tilletia horrida]|nr:hypothetical protein OC861_002353 [Tilletia horrida]
MPTKGRAKAKSYDPRKPYIASSFSAASSTKVNQASQASQHLDGLHEEDSDTEFVRDTRRKMRSHLAEDLTASSGLRSLTSRSNLPTKSDLPTQPPDAV